MIVFFLYCYAWSPEGVCTASAAWTIRVDTWIELPCEDLAAPDSRAYLVSCEKRRDTDI